MIVVAQVGFAQKPKKAIFVIVDGIPADVVEKIETPSLDAIAEEGGYTRAFVGGVAGGYSETPTISAVGYNSLLTGTWVNKHNVWDNDIEKPNYNYWTIFRFFKEQYPEKRIAVFSTWQDNRTKLIGEGLPQTGELKMDYHFDGLELDTASYPHDYEHLYIHHIDDAVVDTAVAHIRRFAPDLSWVYLQYTDDMGHRYGDNKKFYDAVKTMDDQIGRLSEAIKYREKKYNEEWEIYVTTDHGRDAATGKLHGGQTERERTTWIVTNAGKLNSYFKDGDPAITDILPSIARFMNVKIPRTQGYEIDGVPLVGPISISSPSATLQHHIIQLKWKAWEKTGNVKIHISTTNNFKEGGTDDYRLVATVPVSSEGATIDVSDIRSSFYKVVLEAPENSVNVWVGKTVDDQR